MGDEVNFEDKIIFDNTWTSYDCQKQIVKSSTNGFGNISNSIDFLFNSNPNVSLSYSNDDISGMTVAAETVVGFDIFANLTNINVTFDTHFLEHSTDLGIFTFAIHENLHAILYLLLEIENIDINSEDGNLSILAEEYAERKALIIIEQENQYDHGDAAFLQHEAISDLVDQIKTEIMAYGQSKGYDASDYEYEALAWAGLQGTVAFQSLDISFQNSFNQIITNETTGFTILANGQPCD